MLSYLRISIYLNPFYLFLSISQYYQYCNLSFSHTLQLICSINLLSLSLSIGLSVSQSNIYLSLSLSLSLSVSFSLFYFLLIFIPSLFSVSVSFFVSVSTFLSFSLSPPFFLSFSLSPLFFLSFSLYSSFLNSYKQTHCLNTQTFTQKKLLNSHLTFCMCKPYKGSFTLAKFLAKNVHDSVP